MFTRTVEGVGWASLGSRSFRGWFCLANDALESTYEFTGVAGARVKVDYFAASRTGEWNVLAASDGIVGTLRIGRWLFNGAVEGVGWVWLSLAKDDLGSTEAIAGARVKVG